MTADVDESWDWSKASPVNIDVSAFRPLSYADLLPLLEELNKHYTTVRASRTSIEPPMAGGPDVALVLSLVAAYAAAEFVKGFFSELGKESYQGVRRVLLDLMPKGRRSDRGRVYIPLAVRVEPWTFHFVGDDNGHVTAEEFLEQRTAAESTRVHPEPTGRAS